MTLLDFLGIYTGKLLWFTLLASLVARYGENDRHRPWWLAASVVVALLASFVWSADTLASKGIL